LELRKPTIRIATRQPAWSLTPSSDSFENDDQQCCALAERCRRKTPEQKRC
jgi:hypothetical protein